MVGPQVLTQRDQRQQDRSRSAKHDARASSRGRRQSITAQRQPAVAAQSLKHDGEPGADERNEAE